MQGLDVGTFYGFKIIYSPGGRRFYLYNSDGDEVGSANDQATLEERAKTLAKGAWEKWPVIVASNLVTITSFNPLEGKAWSVGDVDQRRRQVDLSYEKVYSRIPENLARITQMEDLGKQIDKLSRQRRDLANGFTGQLTQEDFKAHIKPLKQAVQ